MSSDNVDNEADKPSAETLKPVILEAIGVHLREHGPEDWHLVCERSDFAHVIGQASGPTGSRRFWRWVKKVRGEMPGDSTRPNEGRGANEEHRAWSAEQARRAAESLPVPPPASFFMRRGADGVETIRIFDAVMEIWDDLSRAKALIEGSDDSPAARGKRLGDNALARLKVMATVMEMLDRAHGMDALHHRYRQIIAFFLEDCAQHPELQKTLLTRLRDGNSAPIPLTLLTS